MSWLVIVALLVIFVVRMGFAVASRQRPAARDEPALLSQRTESTSVEPAPVPSAHPDGPASPADDDQSRATTQAREPKIHVDAELEDKVRDLMSSGFEAGAVRLLCDELGIGIHDAQRTVRALGVHRRAELPSHDSAKR
jgi:hypothetical protein